MKTFKLKVPGDGRPIDGIFEMMSKASGLDQHQLQDAAEKGALWLQKKGKGKILRIRTLSTQLDPTDILTLYYDPRILSFSELADAQVLYEEKHYGIWFKAAGIMPQGTQVGDHTSLLRYIERTRNKEIHLVHRLDRETAGVMIYAYSSDGAAKLGMLFQNNLIKKTYECVVLGELELSSKRTVDSSLDDKKAITHFEVMKVKDGKSLLKVDLLTGRLHQIRRHMDAIGHPVIGDPVYGRGNKNRDGLMLLAKSLEFENSWSRKRVFYEAPTVLYL